MMPGRQRFLMHLKPNRLMPAILILLTINLTGVAQSDSSQNANKRRGPSKTIKIGKVRFDYYDEPEAVAASTTFYLSGSATKAHVFDFLAISVAFYNRGRALIQPSLVHFGITGATYRDGCKYRERYADQDRQQLRIAFTVDDATVVENDLAVTPGHVTGTRNGRLCMELYAFEMSFEQFQRLIDADRATLTTGPRSFKFKREHLDALRVMANGIGRY